VINGVRFDWGPGDIFVAPSWASVDHEASARADLFAISDRPVLQALHLSREEELAERQEISGTFVPLQGATSTADAARMALQQTQMQGPELVQQPFDSSST